MRECIEMEFVVENNMMVHYRHNFLNGVKAKLEKKNFLGWIPESLMMVSREMVDQCFENRTGMQLDLRFLERTRI